MKHHRRKPGKAAQRNAAIQAIYTIAYNHQVKRGWDILHDASRLADARKPYEKRQDTADEIKDRIAAYHEKRRAQRLGQLWPICDDCKHDDHHEGSRRGLHITHDFYQCACPCGVKYYDRRTCWCSDMRLRNSVRLMWRWLPVRFLRAFHQWQGKYAFDCTPRWQSIYR